MWVLGRFKTHLNINLQPRHTSLKISRALLVSYNEKTEF